MICPLCRGESWEPCAEAAPARRCRECGGVWSPAAAAAPRDGAAGHAGLNAVDTAAEPLKPKICPDCGRLLAPLSTVARVRVRVDRCLGCGGAWFDPAAWREVALAGADAYAAATSIRALRSIDGSSLEAVREASFAALLGPNEHGRLRDIRNWIERHPARVVMLAYLREHDEPRWREA